MRFAIFMAEAIHTPKFALLLVSKMCLAPKSGILTVFRAFISSTSSATPWRLDDCNLQEWPI